MSARPYADIIADLRDIADRMHVAAWKQPLRDAADALTEIAAENAGLREMIEAARSLCYRWLDEGPDGLDSLDAIDRICNYLAVDVT